MVLAVEFADEWRIIRECYPILARLLDEAGVPLDDIVDVVKRVPIPEEEGTQNSP